MGGFSADAAVAGLPAVQRGDRAGVEAAPRRKGDSGEVCMCVCVFVFLGDGGWHAGVVERR